MKTPLKAMAAAILILSGPVLAEVPYTNATAINLDQAAYRNLRQSLASIPTMPKDHFAALDKSSSAASKAINNNASESELARALADVERSASLIVKFADETLARVREAQTQYNTLRESMSVQQPIADGSGRPISDAQISEARATLDKLHSALARDASPQDPAGKLYANQLRIRAFQAAQKKLASQAQGLSAIRTLGDLEKTRSVLLQWEEYALAVKGYATELSAALLVGVDAHVNPYRDSIPALDNEIVGITGNVLSVTKTLGKRAGEQTEDPEVLRERVIAIEKLQ